jgi:hypothetical protein
MQILDALLSLNTSFTLPSNWIGNVPWPPIDFENIKKFEASGIINK